MKSSDHVDQATALEVALVLEGVAPEARERILQRLYRDPSAPAYEGQTHRLSRVVGARLLGFGTAPGGELIGQEMAALARDMWSSAPGPVSRFWLEWNVTPPPAGLPAALMQMAAQIDPLPEPAGSAPAPLCVNRPELP